MTTLPGSEAASSSANGVSNDDIKKVSSIIVGSQAGALSIVEGAVDDQDAFDDAILRAQGHDAAMPRSFSIMSALGLGFSITNSWVGYAVSNNLVTEAVHTDICGRATSDKT